MIVDKSNGLLVNVWFVGKCMVAVEQGCIITILQISIMYILVLFPSI